MTTVDRYAVVGNPVEHSRSPAIHAMFARQTGQPVEYGRLLSPLDGFAKTVRDFARNGALGCNVTVPFKFEAFSLAERRTHRAELAQAANTLRFDTTEAGGWLADNTDGLGLVRDITVNAGMPLAGKRILLIGAGGASAGVLAPLMAQGPSQIVVANRTVSKAQALVERQRLWPEHSQVELLACELDKVGEGFDVVINGTASSLDGAGVPVSHRVLRPGSLAVDMMYGPAARAFLDWARDAGAQGRDGLGMLIEQAAESFALWRGVRPDTASVLAAMRQQVDAPKV